MRQARFWGQVRVCGPDGGAGSTEAGAGDGGRSVNVTRRAACAGSVGGCEWDGGGIVSIQSSLMVPGQVPQKDRFKDAESLMDLCF